MNIFKKLTAGLKLTKDEAQAAQTQLDALIKQAQENVGRIFGTGQKAGETLDTQ
jgi:hypothetical protein